MRSNEVFSVLEGIYCRKQYMGEEGRLRKCERVSRWVWRENKCKSKITKGVRKSMKNKVKSKYRGV